MADIRLPMSLKFRFDLNKTNN